VNFVLLGKTDMYVLVYLFDGSIESRTQAIGCIFSALGEPNSWLVALGVGGINCYAFCIVGVILGDGCAFILG
jgi:hypothetical protein